MVLTPSTVISMHLYERRELAGRYTTSLYTLEQVLQEAIAAESSDDSDSKALEEVLLQKRSTLVKGKTDAFSSGGK